MGGYPVIFQVSDSRPRPGLSLRVAMGNGTMCCSSGSPRYSFLMCCSNVFSAYNMPVEFRILWNWSYPMRSWTSSANLLFSPSDPHIPPFPGTSSLSWVRGSSSVTWYVIRSTVPPPASQTTNTSPGLMVKSRVCNVYRAAASGSLMSTAGESPALVAAWRVALFAASDHNAGTVSLVGWIRQLWHA